MQATVHTHTVPVLDGLISACAHALSKVSRVTGAGLSWLAGAPTLWDAWTDHSDTGGALTVRMGRLELVVDWRD